ncbi:MAG: hypothetical protein HY700_02045 [Gemmatimonadetes bacterium]|nr:hypothetical protein [Gemmatimonadota bacterium]
MSNGFLHSDAWILLAAVYAAREKPASLSDVIAAADYIEHAVVVFEEMEGALARLTSGGYLAHTAGTVSPTEKTLQFCRGIIKPGRKAQDELTDLRRFIGAAEWAPGTTPQSASVGVSYPPLSRAVFDEAVESYLAHHPKLTGVRKKK